MAEDLRRQRLGAFEAAGLAPNPVLAEMLGDDPGHCTERRGCGLTQATRHLAEHINRPRDPSDPADLAVFAGWRPARVRALAARALDAGWPHGWRGLDQAPPAVLGRLADAPDLPRLVQLGPALARLAAMTQLPEVGLLAALIRQLVGCSESQAPELPAMPGPAGIGSCSQAEEFFLEIAHGRVRRGGRVAVHVEAGGRPVLVEKHDLGESRSAMSVVPVRLNGVELPPGSLFALASSSAATADPARIAVVPLAALQQARFLRLSTLSLPPHERARAFSRQFATQCHLGFLSPGSTTIADLYAVASRAGSTGVADRVPAP